MKLFSEIYSKYYKIIEDILKRKNVTKGDIQDIIGKNGFYETVLFLEPKLIGEDNFGLLTKKGSTYYSILTKPPYIPLTLLEKRWLCAILQDRKSALFLDKEQREKLSGLLGVYPLFQKNAFCFFDKYKDGDNYEDENYIRHFCNVCTAMENKKLIKISFNTRKNTRITHYYLPLKLEYSAKNDKFRVYVISYRNNKAYDTGIINFSQITLTEPSNITPEETTIFKSIEKETVVVKISNERNALNRFMMEFAELERVSEFDEITKICLVTMKYNKKDETEILIRLLSFGPVIEVIAPYEFRDKVKARIAKQYNTNSKSN